LERAAQGMIDENGVILHHNNIAPTENGFWVEAKDLREGDVFLGANGELSTVVSIERVEFPDGIVVYNLTVDGNHNYFVIAQCDELGQTSVLVHNASGYGDDPKPKTLLQRIIGFFTRPVPRAFPTDPSDAALAGYGVKTFRELMNIAQEMGSNPHEINQQLEDRLDRAVRSGESYIRAVDQRFGLPVPPPPPSTPRR
jgi:hypothetical protein